MIEENTVYSLDDGKNYVLVDFILYDNNTYVYLVDIENPNNYMIAVKNGNELDKVTDGVKIKELIDEFNKSNN